MIQFTSILHPDNWIRFFIQIHFFQQNKFGFFFKIRPIFFSKLSLIRPNFS